MGKTSIEWTDRSVNPIRFGRGHYCQKISPGCANCYASRMQPRFGNPEFGAVAEPLILDTGQALNLSVGNMNTDGLWLDQKKLREAIRVTKPSKFFWCDMTDLFAKWVPYHWIDLCFATMALTPQHIHQVLTKRASEMATYIASRKSNAKYWKDAARELGYSLEFEGLSMVQFPLPNVWLGVSCEDQKRAELRIPYLLDTPAAVRFLSCEPLLGPIDLRAVRYMHGSPLFVGDEGGHEYVGSRRNMLHWVITGCESGPAKRPFELEWDADIQEQCREAGVAFFRKQIIVDGKVSKDMAEWLPEMRVREFPTTKECDL